MKTLELNDFQIDLIKHALGIAEVMCLDLQNDILHKTALVRGLDRNNELEKEAKLFFNRSICFADLLMEIEEKTK